MADVIDMTKRRGLALTTESLVKQSEIIEKIRPLLANQPPIVVGAVLGEIVATYIAAHAPSLRKEQRKILLKLIDDIVPIIVEEMIEDGRAPEQWR